MRNAQQRADASWLYRDYPERLRASEDARRRAEETAFQAQAELSRLVRFMSVGQLGSWIAHEIKQPIAAIVTNSDATLRWLSKENPDVQEAQAAVARIIRDANRASAVIGGTRAVLARDTPDVADVDMNQIVEDVILFTQGEQECAQVNIRTALRAGLPQINGDRTQLQQVVLNLVLNAIDAMKSVGPALRVLTIRSDLVESGDVLVSVEDAGVGIDPAHADRLFDPYFSTKADGTGLGLAISRTIVTAHGGRLWASPASSTGAVFQFTLPGSGDRSGPARI